VGRERGREGVLCSSVQISLSLHRPLSIPGAICSLPSPTASSSNLHVYLRVLLSLIIYCFFFLSLRLLWLVVVVAVFRRIDLVILLCPRRRRRRRRRRRTKS
jgi:hypothetical protein